MGFYVGDYKADAPAHRGWIVGTFIESGARKTEDVEIKYWELEAGNNDHPPKVSTIIECTIILSGQTEAVIDGEKIMLKSGDYAVIEPGTPNNLVQRIIESTKAITIKAPSDPSAKKVVENV